MRGRGEGGVEECFEAVSCLCMTAWALSLRQWEQLVGLMWQVEGRSERERGGGREWAKGGALQPASSLYGGQGLWQ